MLNLALVYVAAERGVGSLAFTIPASCPSFHFGAPVPRARQNKVALGAPRAKLEAPNVRFQSFLLCSSSNFVLGIYNSMLRVSLATLYA